MRILSLFIIKYDEENPKFMAQSYELSFVSWYQRYFVKEQVNFGARTCASRAQRGTRSEVSLPEVQAKCYINSDNNGVVALIMTDDQYPRKVAILILDEMLREFYKQIELKDIEQVTQDTDMGFKKLDDFIQRYQDPKEADKLLKLESTLMETTQIVQKSLDDLLKRGESIDSLMAKSKDVSSVSVDFYKKAKQTNQKCCSLY